MKNEISKYKFLDKINKELKVFYKTLNFFFLIDSKSSENILN